MLFTALSVLLAGQSDIVTAGRRIANPAASSSAIENLAVRLASPEGVLWQGSVRVSRNQGANYQQNFSQAFPDACPPDSGYDRSERRSINVSVYAQQSTAPGASFRINVSWARPALDPNCGETGTRTVQVNQTVILQPGKTEVIEGDAGLRVELTLR